MIRPFLFAYNDISTILAQISQMYTRTLFCLFFLLQSLVMSGQQFTEYTKVRGWCGETILLYPNGIYNYGAICEQSSFFSMGYWKRDKDSIHFHELDSSLKVIDKVVTSNTHNSIITVRLFDLNGNNLTSKYRVAQRVNGKGNYTMDLDSSGTFRTDIRRDSGIIILTSIENKLGVKNNIPISADADTYDIYLNDLSILNWVHFKDYYWLTRGNFSMLIDDDGLTTIINYPDDDGVPAKLVYCKEEVCIK